MTEEETLRCNNFEDSYYNGLLQNLLLTLQEKNRKVNLKNVWGKNNEKILWLKLIIKKNS